MPGNKDGRSVSPKVTDDFKGPPTSNDWWSSLIWQYDTWGENPYSGPLYAHPLTLKAEAAGLGLRYPTKPEVSQYHYMYWQDKDLLVGFEGLAAKATRVASYSDWAVTASWQSGGNELRATMGHGFPFVYFTRTGKAPAQISPQRESWDKTKLDVSVWHEGGEWLGLSVADRNYVVFGPSGSEWTKDGDVFRSDLAGKDYFSVAALPDKDAATVELFRKHAYAFVTDTKVSWSYDAASATSKATFQFTTDLKEPGHDHVAEPLYALYRHQWLNTKTPLVEKTYRSPRGDMKLCEAMSFTTEMTFNGVLPMLPNVADNDKGALELYVKQVYSEKDHFPPGLGEKPQRDSYWIGKSMLKVSNVLQIADQIGHDRARDHLLQALKNELEDWFDGREPSTFFYDKTWRTLIAVPGGFSSSLQLNDHHFHYGYFLYAAAVVARFDPAWAQRWKEPLELLVKEVANWDRSDERFPFLRYMDAYAGHSWANGPALFNEGNNEESSSEDTNFSAATVLWGAATGDTAMRDLGIFLYTQQTAAIEQYWWDIDQKVFPKGFDHSAVGMVWGAGGRYDTWWDSNPIIIHGINFLPFSGGALYMGRHPDYVRRNYGEVERRNKGKPLTLRDAMWMYLAFAEPDKALQMYEDDHDFVPEYGNSMAMTHHWLSNMAALGQVDLDVTADTPTYAVFKKGNARTHVAYNPTDRPLTVTFSDGAKLEVAPHAQATSPRQ